MAPKHPTCKTKQSVSGGGLYKKNIVNSDKSDNDKKITGKKEKKKKWKKVLPGIEPGT